MKTKQAKANHYVNQQLGPLRDEIKSRKEQVQRLKESYRQMRFERDLLKEGAQQDSENRKAAIALLKQLQQKATARQEVKGEKRFAKLVENEIAEILKKL